jgi:hypothetical protein
VCWAGLGWAPLAPVVLCISRHKLFHSHKTAGGQAGGNGNGNNGQWNNNNWNNNNWNNYNPNWNGGWNNPYNWRGMLNFLSSIQAVLFKADEPDSLFREPTTATGTNAAPADEAAKQSAQGIANSGACVFVCRCRCWGGRGG